MDQHHTHEDHSHSHGPGCGHTSVKHQGHTDYLHDGHMHHIHDNHIDEHVIEISQTNPKDCTPDHSCHGHELGHIHGPTCGHEAIPHGDHIDFLVDGHLHFPHHAHCDDHGAIQVS